MEHLYLDYQPVACNYWRGCRPKTKEGFELSPLQKGFLIVALFLLTFYATVWLGVNINREESATNTINELDPQFGIPCIFRVPSGWFGWVGYQIIVAGIGLVAIAVVVYAPVRAVHTLSLS